MALTVIFFLGIANFAIHRAVQDSRHPVLGQVPWFFSVFGGWLSLSVEFVMLVGCMVMAAKGVPGWGWGYLLYSGTNGMAAWLILSRRI